MVFSQTRTHVGTKYADAGDSRLSLDASRTALVYSVVDRSKKSIPSVDFFKKYYRPFLLSLLIQEKKTIVISVHMRQITLPPLLVLYSNRIMG